MLLQFYYNKKFDIIPASFNFFQNFYFAYFLTAALCSLLLELSIVHC
jgi:hypothetical protein